MNLYLSAILLGLSLSALAMGIFISMRIFSIPDITTDGSYTLGAAITAFAITHGQNLVNTFLLTFLFSAIAGATTGWIHTRLKVNSLLSGILVMTGLYSINLLIMGRSNVPLIDKITLMNLQLPLLNESLSQLALLTLITMLIAGFLIWLLKTDFGIAMRATGNSESMVRAQGVDPDKMKIIGLAISNALVGISGFLVTQLQGFADINMGIGIVIIGLGSVMIGEAICKWTKKNTIAWRILAVISGSIIFRCILAFSLSLGVNPTLLKLITALFVLIIVAIPHADKD